MKNKLHTGARWIFRISGFFGGIFLMFILAWIIFAALGLAMNNPDRITANYTLLALFLFLLVVDLILAEIYARMAYNRWFYEFTETNLKLERGIIWKRYSNVPYERVQNVDIHRGILARILGFSSVMIQTAGYSGYGRGHHPGSEGSLPAVSEEAAEKIRDFLMKKISKHHGSGM